MQSLMRATAITFGLLCLSFLRVPAAQDTYRQGQMLIVPTLPPTCAIGETVFLGGSNARGLYSCLDVNTWQGLSIERSRVYAMPDNTFVDLFTVDLPTVNTGCSVHHTFTYSASQASPRDTAVDAGIVVSVFANRNGVVSGAFALVGEVAAGVGCPVGCAARQVTVTGTTATGQGKYDNTFNTTGSLTVKVLSTTCAALTFK